MPTQRKLLFQDDFESGMPKAYRVEENRTQFYDSLVEWGTKVEVVDDPTGSGRGKVNRISVSGEPIDSDGNIQRRGHLNWFYSDFFDPASMPAPCGISCDVWIPNSLVSYNESFGPWPGLLSVHHVLESNRLPDPSSGLILAVGGRNLALVTHDGTDNSRIVDLKEPFRKEQWVNLAMVMTPDGTVQAFQDGACIGEVEQLPGVSTGLHDGHAGLLAYINDPSADYPTHAFLLNDNFHIAHY